MGNINQPVSSFTGLTDTPTSLTGASLQAVRVNIGETALEFTDLDSGYLRLDATNSPLTGTLTSQDVIPGADQTRQVGTDAARYMRVSGRLGVFVGSSFASGQGAPASGGSRNFGLNPAGLMAGNQAEGGTGTAVHYLRGGAFKGVACVGNAAAGSTGNALLSNRSGGGTLFGSAYTYGAGDATVEATSFGNFTAAYAYATNNDHLFSNRGAGAFLGGYSRGGGIMTAEITGDGALMMVRPDSNAATGTILAQVTGDGGFGSGFLRTDGIGSPLINFIVSGEGAFGQGSVRQNGAGTSSILSAGVGSLSQGRAFGGRTISALGNGSLAQGSTLTASIIASSENSVQFGPGTNALASSLQVGAAGLRFKGTAGAPGAPQTGDHWVDTTMRMRSDGITWDFNQSVPFTRTAAVVEDRVLLASASATTINNNNVLAALIADLQTFGVLG